MKQRLHELDALRGIAAISVVLFHFNSDRPLFSNKLAGGFFKFGATGVDLFFMISGFVILLTLEKTKTWQDFVFRRFSRLYPTYWVCLTITSLALITYLASHHKPYTYILHEFVPNLTMFQKYFKVPDIDDVYWTLLIEMLFYIFMLLIFCVKQLKNIEYIALTIMLPLFIYSSNYFQVHFADGRHLLMTVLPIVNYFPFFVMGIIYYKMKFDKPNLYRYIAILICVLCQVSLYGNGLNTDLFLSFHDHILLIALYNALFLLYVHDKLKFVVNGVTLFLGAISYPLYLVHYYISVKVVIPLLLSFNIAIIPAAITAFVLTITLATLITKFIEKPSMRYLNARFQKKGQPISKSSIKTIYP